MPRIEKHEISASLSIHVTELRTQLADAQVGLQNMGTERDVERAYRQQIQKQLAWALEGWANTCITRAEMEADLRAVLKVLTAMPAHRDYDSHYGNALARPGVAKYMI